jgi:hypothetical protein
MGTEMPVGDMRKVAPFQTDLPTRLALDEADQCIDHEWKKLHEFKS